MQLGFCDPQTSRKAGFDLLRGCEAQERHVSVTDRRPRQNGGIEIDLPDPITGEYMPVHRLGKLVDGKPVGEVYIRSDSDTLVCAELLLGAPPTANRFRVEARIKCNLIFLEAF